MTTDRGQIGLALPGWRLPAVAVLLCAIAAGVGWAKGVGAVEQAVLIARFTARVSLGFFLILYVIGPTARTWLTAFTLAHLIHFATMVHLFAAMAKAPHTHELIFGCLAYAAPVAVLLVPGNARAWWRRLALDYVWLSFAVTYYHRLFEFPERHDAGVFAFVMLLIALALRLVVARCRA